MAAGLHRQGRRRHHSGWWYREGSSRSQEKLRKLIYFIIIIHTALSSSPHGKIHCTISSGKRVLSACSWRFIWCVVVHLYVKRFETGWWWGKALVKCTFKILFSFSSITSGGRIFFFVVFMREKSQSWWSYFLCWNSFSVFANPYSDATFIILDSSRNMQMLISLIVFLIFDGQKMTVHDVWVVRVNCPFLFRLRRKGRGRCYQIYDEKDRRSSHRESFNHLSFLFLFPPHPRLQSAWLLRGRSRG